MDYMLSNQFDSQKIRSKVLSIYAFVGLFMHFNTIITGALVIVFFEELHEENRKIIGRGKG